MESVATRMRRKDFASYRGVSPAMVTHWGKTGRLVLDDEGMVIVHSSDELIAKSADPRRAGVIRTKPQSTADAAGGNPIRDARLRRELAEAERVERENAAKRRELVPVGPLAALLERLAHETGVALDGLPFRVASRLGVDLREATAAMEDELTFIRETLAERVRKVAISVSTGQPL